MTSGGWARREAAASPSDAVLHRVSTKRRELLSGRVGAWWVGLLLLGSAVTIPLFDVREITFTGDRLLGLAALGGMVVLGVSRRLRWTPLHTALAAFVGIQFLASFANATVWPEGLKFVVIYLLGFACFTVSAAWTADPEIRDKAVREWIVLGGILGVLGSSSAFFSNLLQVRLWGSGMAEMWISQGIRKLVFAARASFAEWNLFGSFLLVPFALALWAWRRGMDDRWPSGRTLGWLGALAFGLVFSLTRAAWVSMAGLILLWWWVTRPRWRQLTILLLFIALALVLQAVSIGLAPLGPIFAGGLRMPQHEVTPLSVAFDRAEVGKRSPMLPITVHNPGPGAVRLGNVSLGGADRDQFRKPEPRDSCSGRTLAAGETCTVFLRFRPMTGGEKNATLIVPSAARGQKPILVALSGTAVGASPAGEPRSSYVGSLIEASPLFFRVLKSVERGEDRNLVGRLHISKATIESWRARPLLGHGAGSTNRLSVVLPGRPPLSTKPWNGNVALFLLHDSGLLGLGAFLGLLTVVARAGRRPARGERDEAWTTVGVPLLAAGVCLLFAYQFTHGLWSMYPYVYLGLLTGVLYPRRSGTSVPLGSQGRS